MDCNKIDKFEIVAYGLSGIDLRVALSESPKINAVVQSVKFVSCPNQGSLLSQLINEDKLGRDLEIRLETILGLNSHQIREFTPQNIRVLNETLED